MIPLYARGVDRAKAQRITAHFMRRYQPPPTCAHRPGPLFKTIDGVRGLFRSCDHCGTIVGIVR